MNFEEAVLINKRAGMSGVEALRQARLTDPSAFAAYQSRSVLASTDYAKRRPKVDRRAVTDLQRRVDRLHAESNGKLTRTAILTKLRHDDPDLVERLEADDQDDDR